MTAAFWDKRSEKYEEYVREHDRIHSKSIDRTKSLLSGSDVVLDFGCGSGETSLDIAPHVRRVHGIDYSAKMIELANQKARYRRTHNVTFSQTDAFDPGLPNSSFSAIVAFNIFHLLEDAPGVLARLHDLLAPGGLLISQTPCLGERNWLMRAVIYLAQKTEAAPRILDLSFDGLESLVSGSNFRISEARMWDEKDAIRWIVARKK